VSGAIEAVGRWLGQLGSGLPGKARLVLSIALAVVLVDHLAKLTAAWLEPADYTHNPEPMEYRWALLLPALALLFPSRLLAGLFALLLGGTASNLIDIYLWPGGVPDFIPIGDWVWNPADFAIYGAVIALMCSPVWKLFRVARRTYPELPQDPPTCP
jgi:lipoprotein signal peptidase